MVSTNVLLSVEPRYAEAILSGAKKYEFRRTIFKRKDIDKVYLYSNSTTKKIVGSFKIEKILKGTPQEIWNTCYKYSGISRKDFFKYFKGSRKAFGIKIKDVHRFYAPVDPYLIVDNFKPPQSFYYIGENIFSNEMI
ncbi:MAG: hypothetical protein QME59_06505 [Candidatus Hydrothermarchaeota archaeon]|nr:hypothetical protein [Candidatus Hydrothermarchaeota archaeon]